MIRNKIYCFVLIVLAAGFLMHGVLMHRAVQETPTTENVKQHVQLRNNAARAVGIASAAAWIGTAVAFRWILYRDKDGAEPKDILLGTVLNIGVPLVCCLAYVLWDGAHAGDYLFPFWSWALFALLEMGALFIWRAAYRKQFKG